jgi:hypothetical protein
VYRRRLLALLAGGVPGLAGCTGESPGTATATPETGTDAETPSGTASRTPTPTPAPAPDAPTVLDAGEAYEGDGWTLAVENPRARRGIVEFGTAHPDPRLPADRQFVAFDVGVGGDGPDPADPCLAARLDGSRPFGTCERRYVHSERNGERDGRAVQVTAAPVPLGIPPDPAAASASVVWRRENGAEVAWRLPDAVLAALRSPPRFEVRSVAAPDAAEPEAEFPVEVAVANVGERDGVFVAEVGPAAMSDQPDFELPVPAGETARTTRQVRAHFPEGEDETTVRLNWDRDALTRTVRRA